MNSQESPEKGDVPNGNGALTDDESLPEDDRSSSLSEIDDESDQGELDIQDMPASQNNDLDSEAETERLEASPHTPGRHGNIAAVPFEKSPSKLAQAMSANDDVTGGDGQYSESEMTSPLPSLEEHLDNEMADAESVADQTESEAEATDLAQSKKRKRGQSEESNEQLDPSDGHLRKRTGSVKEGVASAPMTDEESEGEAEPVGPSRESSEEREASPIHEEVVEEEEGEEIQLEPEAITAKRKSLDNARQSRSSKSKEATVPEEEDAEEAEEVDAVDEVENVSEDENAGEELDEAEAERKDEEEFAKKMVAMEALGELEKQFAILRDKLYDERIGEINKQLMQLTGPEPTNAEYVEKMQFVLRHRDEKQEYEHKLFAFKVQSLKTKSVAERSQIHSAYYQSIRDIRERHLDMANEQFSKIQRDRFRPDENMVNFSIPFPERRSQQITQQASYNREVSVLSGVAKYVGFPAAPEITPARPSEVEEDLEKMGLPSQPVRALAPPNGNSLLRLYSSAAEEQFLEQTPWANPQHPVHNRMTRQYSEQDNSALFTTPAGQKTTMDPNATNGSASTIPENLSAQASSALNTPHDQDGHNPSTDGPEHRITGRVGENIPPRTSLSPTDTRKTSLINHYRPDSRKAIDDGPGPAIHSPPQTRTVFNPGLRQDVVRAPSAQHDSINRHQNSSPLTSLHATSRTPSIAAGSGYNRFGTR